MCTTTLALLLSLSLTTPPAAEGLITVEPRRAAPCRSVMATAAADADARLQAERDRADSIALELAHERDDDRTRTGWIVTGSVLGGLLVGGLVVGLSVAYGSD